MTGDPIPDLDLYIEAALGRKAQEIVVLDVGDLTSLADAFIICHGTSNRQVSAIAEHIKRDLKKKGISPVCIDGLKEGRWVLMDYGDIIIHVFYEEVRRFYDLEGLWVDAGRITTKHLKSVDENDNGDWDESVYIE